MSVGFNTVFPKRVNTIFKVRNKAKGGKRIRLFNYPIANGEVRDLMNIPYVSEADIRHSLLKGELRIKIDADEIEVVDSNIDLLQFDSEQKAYLEAAGVNDGLTAGGGGAGVNYLWRQGIELVGPKNNSNTTFIIPGGETFLSGIVDDNDFRILVDHNGRRLLQNIDFITSESGGPGTGYDTIRIISFVPSTTSKLIADYVVST